jgi:predicted  nucleic acid-binding Zn-ribbon protein
VADIQQKLHTLYDHVYGESGLNTIIDGLQDDVEKMGEEVHAHGTDLDLLQNDFTAIFAKNFDPFRTSMEEQLKAHGQTFIQHFESLSKLEERIIKLQSEEETRTFTVSQLQSLNNLVHSMAAAKEHLSRLQNSLNAEVHQRNAAVEDLKKQVALKQDTLVATQAIDTVKAAVRNLQDQYDNISTDDLHQKMVHWFLQAYPSNAANMIQQFGVIQHEIAQLRKFTDQISRIPDGTQTLSALAQIGPQLITLAQSPPGYKDSVEGLAESKEALKSMSETMTKLQTQYVGLAHTVGSLQAFMRSLNSNTAPFARAESLVALQESIRKLQEEERQARNEFATKAGKEHDQRVEAEGKIRRGINDLTTKIDKELKERIEAEQEIVFTNNQWFKEFEKDTTGKIKATSEQLEALQAALDKFRADFNEVLDDTSKEFLNRLPTLYVVTAELQTFLEDLNMNLPKGPLHIEWTADLNADVFATPAPESDESRNAARKGKSKQ